MAKTIGIIAIKGGVGKTTVASSLAVDLANTYGKKVLLIDANYSAPNLGMHMGILAPQKTIHDILIGKAKIHNAIHKKFGVDVIPGSFVFEKRINPFKLSDKIKKIKDEYDFVILDSSPSLNEEVLSTMLASDYLFVVTTPDYPTLYCSLRAAKLALQRGKPISGIILNKTSDPRFELSLKEIEEASRIPVVAKVPFDNNCKKALFYKMPIQVYDKKSKFSKEITRLGAALALKKENGFSWKKLLGLDFNREEVNRQFLKDSFYTGVFR